MQINLLPQPSPVQQTRNIILWSITGVLVLVNLWIGVSWMGANIERRQQEAALQDIQRRIELLQVELEKRNKIERQVNQYETLMQWSASRPNYRWEVHLLSSLLPEKSFLTSVNFVEENTFELNAVLPDMESVATYLRHLENDEQIDNVLVQNITRRELEAAEETALLQSGNTSLSFIHHLWNDYVKPLFTFGVAYASDDGSETDGSSTVNDVYGNRSGSGGAGRTSGSGGSGAPSSGTGSSQSSRTASDVDVVYELNLVVTMKRDQ